LLAVMEMEMTTQRIKEEGAYALSRKLIVDSAMVGPRWVRGGEFKKVGGEKGITWEITGFN